MHATLCACASMPTARAITVGTLDATQGIQATAEKDKEAAQWELTGISF